MIDERELDALIRLLDDEDPEVSEHVWSKLIALGTEGIDQLEAAWEIQEDPAIQGKIEELIQRIVIQDITDELFEWRKAGGKSLFVAWSLITRVRYPEIDLEKYKNEINRLVNKTWLEIHQGMSPVQKIRVLNRLLFVTEGYTPNRKGVNDPENFLLNHVIDHKSGNPLSLSLLYLIICKKLDLPVSGVLLPGYFILIYKDRETEFYIDVYNKGIVFSRNDLKRFLEKIKAPEKPTYYKPTSSIYIVLSTLKSMASAYRKQGEPERAAVIDQILKDIDIRLS